MINLVNNAPSTTKMQIVRGSTKTTNEMVAQASWDDDPQDLPGANQVSTNGATAVDLVTAAPAVGHVTRRVRSLSVYNADTVTDTITVQILKVNSAGATTSTTVLTKVSLGVGYTLTYDDGKGWNVYDASGQLAAVSTTTVSSAASQVSSAASAFAGQSSQASSMAALTPASVSSQASSVAALTPASVSSQASSIAAAISPASINSASSQASSMAAIEATISSVASRTKSSFSW